MKKIMALWLIVCSALCVAAQAGSFTGKQVFLDAPILVDVVDDDTVGDGSGDDADTVDDPEPEGEDDLTELSSVKS